MYIKISKLSLLLLFMVAFAACKKNINTVPDVVYNGGPIVNFNNYYDADGVPGYLKYESVLKDSFIVAKIEVKLSNTTEPADHDIKVYLTKSDALVTEFNNLHGTSLVPLSNLSAGWKFDFTQPVIIRKGERKATIPFMINPLKFDLTKLNAIGIAIDHVEGATVNTGGESRLVVEFGARNKYDGRYSLKGIFYHPTSANKIPFAFDVEMQTSGANSVKMFDPVYFGDYIHPWVNNSLTVTGFAGQSPDYTIDPATNKVTVQNTAPGAVTFYTMAAGYNSRYDPATKTIYAKWGYNYAAGGVFDAVNTREFTDTLIYLGPR